MFKYNSNRILGTAITASSNKTQIVASMGGGLGSSPSIGTGGPGANFNSSGTFLGVDLSFHILQDIVNYQDQVVLDRIFREMYTMCPICGSSIDLLSRLPWSSYSLIGVEDPAKLEIYKQSCSELNLEKLMRNFQTNKLTFGRAIGTLVFNSTRGVFTDCIIHNVTNCEITQIPLVGYDPKIDIKLDKDFMKFLHSQDYRDVEARKELSPELLAKLIGQGKIELEPLKTIFIARNELVGCENLSVLLRILPMWLLEKALLRGTILGATRRQKPIMHITMGDGDTWDPDESQYASISQLFANADRDPLGAVIATRPDVSVNEVRNGADFWRVSDEQDMFTQIKLRAFGLSESFLSGDATIGNADASITMLLEQLRNDREDMTNAICRDKIFINLAKYHGFRKRTQAELTHNVRYDTNSKKASRDPKLYRQAVLFGSRNLAEFSAYEIPEVRWTRELNPKGDTSGIEMLRGLKEDGIPIPAAMLATAAGFNLQTIMDSYEEDLENRKRIKEYMDTLEKEGGGANEDGEDEEEPTEDTQEEDTQEEPTEAETAEEPAEEELQSSVLKEPIQLVSNLNNVKDKNTLISYLRRTMPENVSLTPTQANMIVSSTLKALKSK